jgi:hypothetical protein
MTTASPQPSLTLEERRQFIFASLLRYAPETASLRERALDRIVLAALLGSTEIFPYRVGRVQSALVLAPDAPVIRPEIIQGSLQRLTTAGKVKPTEVNKRHAYFLTPEAAQEVTELIGSGEDLFRPVLNRLLENTDHLLPRATAETICREFISECFARFGVQIAKTVAGQVEPSDLLRCADVQAAFKAAATGKHLISEALESLGTRCLCFLTSTEPDDVRLKFHLTQGYYFVQLLGIPEGDFDLLTEQAFVGTVFYLDTNVILGGLLGPDKFSDLFHELITVTKRLGIELRITRATVNEIRRVAADRLDQVRKIIDALPEELLEKTHDQFITAFLDAREKESTLSPESFFDQFDHVPQIASERWGIEFIELTEEEAIGKRDFGPSKLIFQEEALTARGFEKSDQILLHDVAHYAIILDERKQNAKTWFLTRDRSLPVAAARLKGNERQPFSFSLLGFLQSVSPFLVGGAEEQRIAGIFAGLLTEQLLPREQLFNVKELVLLVEMHQDVLATPKEQLITAVDYVKTAILRGKQYKIEDCAQVALGLKSFLASSADEKRKELEAERSRLELETKQQMAVALDEREQRRQAERTIREQLVELADLRDQASQQAQQIAVIAGDLQKATGLVQDLQQLRTATEKRVKINRLTRAVLGLLIGGLLLRDSTGLASFMQNSFQALRGFSSLLIVIKIAAWGLFLLPTLVYVRRTDWPDQGRVGLIAVLLIAGFGLSGGYSGTPLVSVAATAGLVAAALVLGFSKSLGTSSRK